MKGIIELWSVEVWKTNFLISKNDSKERLKKMKKKMTTWAELGFETNLKNIWHLVYVNNWMNDQNCLILKIEKNETDGKHNQNKESFSR